MKRAHWVALVVFALLAAAHTWPLAAAPSRYTRVDNADGALNAWAISWVAHQIVRDPRHLFDANIFYPEPLTLAYSEAMIVQGVMALPLRALGASPVTAYNIVLMAGMALTGWAFYLLVWRWTGNRAAAYVAGSLAGFNPAVLVRLPHLQTQHAEFFALILLALDRVLAVPRARAALLLGLGVALQGLTSIYLFVFSIWMMLFAVVGRAGQWLRRDPIRTAAMLLVAGAAAGVIMSPYLLAYFRLQQLQGFERRIDETQQFAGSWTDYLSTGGRFHYELWSRRFFHESVSASFPGVLGLVLAGLALFHRETRGDARVRMCLAAALGCAAVSFAPHAPFYPLLYRLIPLFSTVRVGAHLGQIVLMLFAVLAGFGTAVLARRWKGSRRWPAVAVALCVVVNLETLRAPLGYPTFEGIPKVYHELAAVPHAVVVEMPFWPPRFVIPTAPLMLFSTAHWHPILNGYSGFQPQSYRDTFEAVKDFPDDTSLVALHERGVTHVIVHRSQMYPERFDAIARIASLQWQDDDGEVYLYKLRN